MTIENRLAKSDARPGIVPPDDPNERRRFWIERGNRLLRGQEPMTGKKYAGQFISPPRLDLEWVCINGSYAIQRRERPAQ